MPSGFSQQFLEYPIEDRHVFTSASYKERSLSAYLLTSGDVLVIAAGILSVAYLSWKRKAK